MRGWKWLPLVAVAGLVWAGCDEQPTSPDNTANSRPLFTASTDADAYTGGGSITGAIWTSDQNRDVVNENVGYDTKEDVFLNGGPLANRPNAPGSLSPTDTWYVLQVTNPAGDDLLSNDPWWCRLVRVENGRFVDVPDDADDVRNALTAALGTNFTTSTTIGGAFTKVQGKWSYDNDLNCNHVTGPDYADTFDDGSISVQLYPYDNTPNNGGVYKTWITPVRDFTCNDQDSSEYEGEQANSDPNYEGCGEQWHGFVGAFVKTDNYKVKETGAEVDGLLIVKKFHDADFDGVKDETEEWVTGWEIDVTDPLSTTNTYYTQVNIPVVPISPPDVYGVEEDEPTGTLLTATYVDDVDQSEANPVNVTFLWNFNGGNYYEEHTVVFGNVGLGSIEACKAFGESGGAGIPGWKLVLTGTLADDAGTTYGPDTQYTESDGCYTWTGLYPGDYTVTEVLPPSPPDYTNVTPLHFDVTISSSLTYDGDVPTIAGTDAEVEFVNYCTDTADFDTKGYWHNKNGLAEIQYEFLTGTVDPLAPYQSVCPADDFFGMGDRLLSDGEFCNGDPVEASFGEGISIAPAGSWQAEVSHFLVDNVNDGGQCEQLAEQLLAFIFNVEYRLGGGGIVVLPDLSTASAQSLIDGAVADWVAGDEADCTETASLLDWFNNNDNVQYVPDTYCPFNYTD